MSNYGSGLDAFIGIGKETVYGTYAVPTLFGEFNSESLTVTADPISSFGLGRGRHMADSRWVQQIVGGSGDLELPVTTKGFGLWLLAAFGKVVSSQPDAAEEPLHYQHLFTEAANLASLPSYTLQVERSTTDGVNHAFSFLGGVLTDWSLTVKTGDALVFKPSFDFSDHSIAEALAVPSYASGAHLYGDIDMSIVMDGADACITGVTIDSKGAWANDRRCLGGKKKRALANGEFELTGSIDKEFSDLDAYNKFIAGERAALVISATAGEIDAGKGDPFQFVMTIPNLVYTGAEPNVGGPDVLNQSLAFKALDNGVDPFIEVEYHSDEATIGA